MKGSYFRGSSLLGTLFVLFLVLRLTHVVEWSWWWVTSPVWLPVAMVVAGGLLAGVVAVSSWRAVSRAWKRRSTDLGRSRAGAGPPGASGTGHGDASVVEAFGREIIPASADASSASDPPTPEEAREEST